MADLECLGDDALCARRHKQESVYFRNILCCYCLPSNPYAEACSALQGQPLASRRHLQVITAIYRSEIHPHYPYHSMPEASTLLPNFPLI